MKALRIVLGALVLACLATSASWAQAVASAQISGVVRDSSGGVLPGAEVTVTKTDTGTTRTAFTDENGFYVLPNLPVGPYRLTVVLQGFNTYVRDGIVLQVNTNPTIDVTLTLGAIEEQVTVVAGASMVETRTTGVGQVIDNQRVLEMPLNGRVATELIFLAGLATPAPSGDLNTNKNYPTVTISVAGGQANGMTYIMDGGTHNDPFNNLNLPTLFPDALQEFKVESSALPARYGHHAASAVNLVTKSGTNELHGNAFHFVRNYMFNAKNFFARERDSLKRNQPGGTLGGPIKKDRLFFFTAYQGRVERSNPDTTLRYVPTQAMLNGDFTMVASPQCQAGRQLSLRSPFVGNRVDPARFSSVALNFLKHVPVSDDPCGLLQFGIPNNSTEHQTMGKVDYTISPSQSLMVRYLYARYENPATYDGKNVLTLSRTGQLNQVHSVVAGHNWVLSPKSLNAFHFTYYRTLNDRPLPKFFSPADLGANVYSPLAGYMGISVTGAGFSVGAGGTNPGYFNSEGYQLADDVDLIIGQHQVSFGVNWIYNKIETLNNRPTNGQFTFNGQFTGLSLADFLLGYPSSFIQGNPVYDYDYNHYVGAYVQDEWRIRPNLTVNVGVRWEPWMPIKNTLGYSSNFDLARFDQGIKSQTYPQAPAGLLFTGDPGFPGKATSFGDLVRFVPRTGVIWTPDEKTSIRAAWGMFADTPHLFFNTRFANNPPWGAQITIPSPVGGFADPYLGYPGGNPFPRLATEWKTAPFPAFGIYVNTPLHLRPTTLYQWNVSVQRQVGEWLLAASYLGNHSSHLWRGTELNPAIYGPGATTANTNQRRFLYLRNRTEGQYYGTIGHVDDTGQANYNGLLVSVQRRLSRGFSVLGNWTLSKCVGDPATTEITGPTIVDPNNPELDYSYCDSDRRHVVNISSVVNVPEFDHPVAKRLFSGWQFAPIIRWQSGNRSSVTLGIDRALTGVGNQRAVQVLDNPYGDKTPNFYLNPAAFAQPALGTYSTLKRNTIVNPPRFQNDVAVTRTFRLAPDRTLQFRWEVFNVVNWVNFNAPVTALNNANFGKIQSAGDPRIMQFALKFAF